MTFKKVNNMKILIKMIKNNQPIRNLKKYGIIVNKKFLMKEIYKK